MKRYNKEEGSRCIAASLIIAVFFLLGSSLAGAQEIDGYIITEDGDLMPDYEPPYATGEDTFFIQKNSVQAIHEMNDFHRLELTESQMNELAEKLENEVYPRYDEPITDIQQFLTDVNLTLELGLSEEQIEAQIEEMTRPRSPEEFEIPLRFPPESLVEVFGRVPSDESAPYFIGSNRLLMFYIDDAGTSNAWTEAQKLTARDRVVESQNWFLAKDTNDYISSVSYARFPQSFEVNFTNDCTNTWMDAAAVQAGFTDLEDCLRYYKGVFNADYIVALFLISEDARSQACPYVPEMGGGYGHWDERCIIFSYRGSGAGITMADAGVYKHEILHLYGACDEYYSSQCNSGCGECVASYPDFRPVFLNQYNCEYCTATPVSCIMRSGAHGSALNNDICVWSMGQIGWVCPASVAAKNSSLEIYIPLIRQFRDDYLLVDTNPIGKLFVHYYYKYAPEMVDLMARHESMKWMMRSGLVSMAVISAIFVKTSALAKVFILLSLSLMIFSAVHVRKRRKKSSSA